MVQMKKMSEKLVSDELWSQVEPLLPEKPIHKGGRPRISDRAALTGIIFILKTGIQCGKTCLRRWAAAVVWPAGADFYTGRKLVFGRSSTILSCKICTIRKRSTETEPVLTALSSGQKGGRTYRPNPVNRGRPGSKHHVITDRNGIPLVVSLPAALPAANVNDYKMLKCALEWTQGWYSFGLSYSVRRFDRFSALLGALSHQSAHLSVNIQMLTG